MTVPPLIWPEGSGQGIDTMPSGLEGGVWLEEEGVDRVCLKQVTESKAVLNSA